MSKPQETIERELDRIDPESSQDTSPATKHDVDVIITERLMEFHEALLNRRQIKPIPPKEDWLNPGPCMD